MTAEHEPDSSPKLTPSIQETIETTLRKITRRQWIAAASATGGTLLLSQCARRMGERVGDPVSGLTTPVARPSATATLVATPTTTPTSFATRTPPPSVTPEPTVMATVTRLRPTPTPTSAETLYLPAVGSQVITLTPSNGYPVDAAPSFNAPYPVPATATPQPPTATAQPTATTPPPTPTQTPAPPTATPQPSATPTPSPTPLPPCLDPNTPPPETGAPLFGLHASADPSISDAERCLFRELRPSLIKVLTFHPPPDLARLIASQPYPSWIIRTFLSFGGRDLSPEQFVEFTLSDTQRTVGLLAGFRHVVELHNEPNLTAEGLGASWADGQAFNDWWLAVLASYRSAMPNTQFIYPGLSPGADVAGIRQAHVAFLEASRAAVEAADGLGIHLYWSAVSPMSDALNTLDDYIARFPNKPIWITEASYNTGGIDDAERARQYLAFGNALRGRPTVQGVTFFVASASDPTFAEEAWLGKSIATQLGQRDQ